MHKTGTSLANVLLRSVKAEMQLGRWHKVVVRLDWNNVRETELASRRQSKDQDFAYRFWYALTKAWSDHRRFRQALAFHTGVSESRFRR